MDPNELDASVFALVVVFLTGVGLGALGMLALLSAMRVARQIGALLLHAHRRWTDRMTRRVIVLERALEGR